MQDAPSIVLEKHANYAIDRLSRESYVVIAEVSRHFRRDYERTVKMSKSMTDYKRMLQHASELKSQGLDKLFMRIQLLVTVFEDHEFRANGADDFALASILDKYVDDTALGFLELRAVLQVFPNCEQWKKVPLRKMYQEALERHSPSNRKNVDEIKEPEKRISPVVSRKQFESVVKDLEQSQKLTVQIKSEIDELREENQSLKKEIVRLEYQVEELEGILEKSRS